MYWSSSTYTHIRLTKYVSFIPLLAIPVLPSRKACVPRELTLSRYYHVYTPNKYGDGLSAISISISIFIFIFISPSLPLPLPLPLPSPLPSPLYHTSCHDAG